MNGIYRLDALEDITLADTVSFMRSGLNVRRYHQRYTAEVDTVGKHSAGVACYVLLIDPKASADVIKAAVVHDLAECVVGDIPAPTKREFNAGAREQLASMEDRLLEVHGLDFDLNAQEWMLIKVADYLDGLSFCVEESLRGNRPGMAKVADTYIHYLEELIKAVPDRVPWLKKAEDVKNVVVNMWRGQ